MHDEHSRYYRQWRAEYLRRLDADYREWLDARRKAAATPGAAPGGPQFRHPPPFEPAHGHDAGMAESLGRAVSNVVMGSAAHVDRVTGVQGEDQTDSGPAPEPPISRSRGGR